jgi:hypothetical protein
MINWKEIDLFNWLKENIYPDLVMAKSPISKWDCYSPKTGHRLELKCRRKHYDTLLIEKKKYDSMIQECDKHLDTPMYFNSTPNGIYSFNLNLITPNWEINDKNPATTYFTKNEKISKEVAYLEISQAKELWKTKL